MDCGGKRSATPLWLRAERAHEPETTLSTSPRLRRQPKRRRRFRSAGALHIVRTFTASNILLLGAWLWAGPFPVPGPRRIIVSGKNLSDEPDFPPARNNSFQEIDGLLESGLGVTRLPT